jgi:hypothetical protein
MCNRGQLPVAQHLLYGEQPWSPAPPRAVTWLKLRANVVAIAARAFRARGIARATNWSRRP